MTALRRLLPPAARDGLRQLCLRVRARAPLLRPWSWATRRHASGRFEVVTLAPKADEARARGLLGLGDGGLPCPLEAALDGHVVLVTPLVVPKALRVPCQVHSVVPLRRPLEEVLARYDRELRRTLRRDRGRFTARRVMDPAEVDRLDREMLLAYAQARHGQGAVCPTPAAVRALALETGRLDVVEEGGRAVACHLGYARTRGGARHWVTLRFGYPPEVFEDARRLREVNAMNAHLALEWAHARGFDGYDLGSAPARPDDGLLQWKRRRDGALDVSRTEEWLSVRVPPAAQAEFLWEHPLFAAEAGGLALHLGLAPGVGDEPALLRWRQLGFSGLLRVHLHAHGAPSERLVSSLRELFEGQTARPEELVVHAPRPAPEAGYVPAPAT